MKIALFGGTGKLGSRVLTRALVAGHDVQALVRNPAKLTTTSDRLTVIEGDVLDAAAVDRTVTGADLVLSLFGQVPGSPKDLQTRGTQLIVDAMRRHGIERIISLSGGGLRAPQDRPKLPDRLIRGAMKMMVGHLLTDAENHLKVLEQSGLDWTVVRAPRLNENPGTGAYRVGWVGVNASTATTYDDLADFVLTQLSDAQYRNQLPFVSA